MLRISNTKRWKVAFPQYNIPDSADPADLAQMQQIQDRYQQPSEPQQPQQENKEQEVNAWANQFAGILEQLIDWESRSLNNENADQEYSALRDQANESISRVQKIIPGEAWKLVFPAQKIVQWARKTSRMRGSDNPLMGTTLPPYIQMLRDGTITRYMLEIYSNTANAGDIESQIKQQMGFNTKGGLGCEGCGLVNPDGSAPDPSNCPQCGPGNPPYYG